MLLKTSLFKSVNLSTYLPTIVKFNESNEFTVIPYYLNPVRNKDYPDVPKQKYSKCTRHNLQPKPVPNDEDCIRSDRVLPQPPYHEESNTSIFSIPYPIQRPNYMQHPPMKSQEEYTFVLENIKGVFEYIKIFKEDDNNIEKNFDTNTQSFSISSATENIRIKFEIEIEVEYKEVEYVIVSQNFNQNAYLLQILNEHECYKKTLTLPDYECLKFRYYIKKITESEIEFHIQNPLNVFINGKIGDFKITFPVSNDLKLDIAFIFDPRKFKSDENNTALSLANNDSNKKGGKPTPIFYDIMSDAKYADVVIISFDEVEIYSYRCVLAKYSEVFKNKFEEIKTLPVKIGIKEFNASIINAALNFCYGKPEAIIGKEGKLFEFAIKFKIKELKDACQDYFETKVDIKNVCEFIEIAYANNFEDLKKKCQHILKENKNKVDQQSFKQLSKDILFDVFCA